METIKTEKQLSELELNRAKELKWPIDDMTVSTEDLDNLYRNNRKERVIHLAEVGLTLDEIYQTGLKKYPGIEEDFKEGRIEGLVAAKTLLYSKAMDGDNSALMFYIARFENCFDEGF